MSTKKLTPRGKDRRRQLMDFAAHRFAENGYHPTSVAEIVSGLGVGKGVFYWYFSSKEELFRAILRDAQLDLRRTQRDALHDVGDPLAQITAGIRASVHWSTSHPDLVTLVAFAATDERFAPMLRKGEQIAIADTAKLVSAGIDQGLIPIADPELLATAMIGVATVLTHHHFLHDAGRTTSVDELADATVRFCLGGMSGT
jgi:AcrR family transcriptional regulator